MCALKSAQPVGSAFVGAGASSDIAWRPVQRTIARTAPLQQLAYPSRAGGSHGALAPSDSVADAASSSSICARAALACGVAAHACAPARGRFCSSKRRRVVLQASEGASGSGAGVATAQLPNVEGDDAVAKAARDIAEAGQDVGTPHWSVEPMKQRKPSMRLQQMTWKDAHGAACVLSGVVFLFSIARFIMGEPPSDLECYLSGMIYAVIYASRFSSIRGLEPHFRVTFYATTGWTIYYIAHLLAATWPAVFAHSVYPTGIIFIASTIYFYAHWLGRMYRHFVEDRFRPYYVPGLAGLMYFHGLDLIDLMNQWLDKDYWDHIVIPLPDQAWTIKDVRLTGLFMSSAALFMITLHNKGVLTGGQNTLITVLFTIFVPAFLLAGTHANLQASFP